MQENKFEWNGFAGYGDVNELDRIIRARGVVNIDKADLERCLSTNGENYVLTACGDSTSHCFKDAFAALPKPISQLRSLILEVCYGSRQLLVSDMADLISTEECKQISDKLTLLWGVAEDDALGDKFKIVLIASY